MSAHLDFSVKRHGFAPFHTSSLWPCRRIKRVDVYGYEIPKGLCSGILQELRKYW